MKGVVYMKRRFFKLILAVTLIFVMGCSNIIEDNANSMNSIKTPEEISNGKARLSLSVKSAESERTIFPEEPKLKDMTYRLEMENSNIEQRTETVVIDDFESNYTGTASSWGRTSYYSYKGSYSLVSTNNTNNSTSSYTLTIENCSSISFAYKVSSESNFDKLKFYIDDNVQNSDGWSGTIGWTMYATNFAEGTHTFRWEYSKDDSENRGSDCAWIDDITCTRVVYQEVIADSLTSDASGNLTSPDGDIVMDADTYPILTLTASKDGVDCYSATLENVEVKADGTTTLSFELKKFASGSGNISVTLNLPTDIEIKNVKGRRGSTSLSSSYGSYKNLEIDETTDDNNNITAKSVTYKEDGVSNGSYVLEFKFYSDENGNNEIKPGYREAVIVSPNLLSSKTITLDSSKFEQKYSITYVDKLQKGDELIDLLDDFSVSGNSNKTSFTKYETVTFDSSNLRCRTCTFDNFYSDENCTTAITEIPAGTAIDQTIYCKWTLDNPVKDDFESYALGSPYLWSKVQEVEPKEGETEETYCLKSSNNDDSSIGTYTLTIPLCTSISFKYKVSSESYDKLYFYIDDELQIEDGWSGEIEWTDYPEKSFEEGTHTFKWEYKKDSRGKAGSDCAWIDEIEVERSVQ